MLTLSKLSYCDGQAPEQAPDLIYRGEGNSSLVIAIRSDAKVLRLLKKDGKIVKLEDNDHVRKHAASNIKFIDRVMLPLANPHFIETPGLIHLKSDLIAQLIGLVKDLRPLHRMNKSLIHDDQDALIMRDYCSLLPSISQYYALYLVGPIISVEIKPKQGFLPITNDVNNTSCLYGLAQHLKLAKGRITRISQYCPLDLFSGCPMRMRQALKCLIHTPQNNFRIFKDLLLVYGECNRQMLPTLFDKFLAHDSTQMSSSCHDRMENRFIDLIIKALLSPFPVGTHNTKINQDFWGSIENLPSCTSNEFCQTHPYLCRACSECTDCQHNLDKDCVLANVLRIQKLDSIGPSTASHMLQWLIRRYGGFDRAGDRLSAPVIPQGLGSRHRQANETKLDYYHRKVWEFLVSLTAKDCSIMISMQRLRDSVRELHLGRISSPDHSLQNHILKDPETGVNYLFSIGLTDLDQKSPHKISRMCGNYERMLLSKKEQVGL